MLRRHVLRLGASGSEKLNSAPASEPVTLLWAPRAIVVAFAPGVAGVVEGEERVGGPGGLEEKSLAGTETVPHDRSCLGLCRAGWHRVGSCGTAAGAAEIACVERWMADTAALARQPRSSCCTACALVCIMVVVEVQA